MVDKKLEQGGHGKNRGLLVRKVRIHAEKKLTDLSNLTPV